MRVVSVLLARELISLFMKELNSSLKSFEKELFICVDI